MATTPGRINEPNNTSKEGMQQQTAGYLDQVTVNGREGGGTRGVSLNCRADNRDSLQCSTTKTKLFRELVNETTNCKK